MAEMAEPARFRISIKPVWRDMDALAHVNNAVYSTWLETAREAWWTAAAGPFDTFPFLVARIELDFLRAVTWRDALELTLWVSRIGNSSFDLAYAISDRDGRRVADARTVQVMYDHAARRAVPIDAALRGRLQAFASPG
jgi:acyl-CoA thioester hydrolase